MAKDIETPTESDDGTSAAQGTSAPATRQSQRRKWLTWLGVLAILFFLVKGLLWLLVPILAARAVLNS
jgi:hypothetical protein